MSRGFFLAAVYFLGAGASAFAAQSPDRVDTDAALRDPNPAVRIEALRKSPRGPQAYQAAKQAMLEDLNGQVRAAAAAAVLSYPGGEPLGEVEKLLAQEKAPQVRKAICLELADAPAQKGAGEATDILTSILMEDKDIEVREAALRAIELRADRRALEPLRRAALTEQDGKLRGREKEDFKKLSVLPKPRKAKPKPVRVFHDAAPDANACGNGKGWCVCARGSIRPKRQCVSRDECAHEYENSFSRYGYRCTWDGANLD